MKNKVLIGINDFLPNSIGISLLSLLNRIDYSRFDIDLIFVNSQQSIMTQIPKTVNIIFSPFSEKKLSFFDKLKFRKKYAFSLLYDIENPELSGIIQIASKNNAVYIHKDYSSIYMVNDVYNNFYNSNKIFKFSKVLFANNALKEFFLKKHPEFVNNSEVLNYIIDEQRIINLSKENISVKKPDHKTLLVFVGSLNDRSKNFSLMVNMMKNLMMINNKVCLWIIGDGPDLVNIKMLVKENNLEDSIQLFGFKNNPYPYLAQADYYLNTADSIDASTSLTEAKVLCKPIISTSIIDADSNTHIISSNVEKVASDVNNIIIGNVKYEGVNNFWVENQKIIKVLEDLITRN